jgi:hypothetical protein
MSRTKYLKQRSRLLVRKLVILDKIQKANSEASKYNNASGIENKIAEMCQSIIKHNRIRLQSVVHEIRDIDKLIA